MLQRVIYLLFGMCRHQRIANERIARETAGDTTD
jgi:hypothetical protein